VAPSRGPTLRLSWEEARQAYELRRALEGLAAELAAARATPDETQKLRHIVRNGYAALGRADYASIAEGNPAAGWTAHVVVAIIAT